jgi:hypothetical protein
MTQIREDYKVPPSMCPHCGYVADGAMRAASDGAGREPEPGDVGVCIKCAGINRYNDKLQLEILPAGAFKELSDELRHEVMLAQRAVILMNVKRSRAAT